MNQEEKVEICLSEGHKWKKVKSEILRLCGIVLTTLKCKRCGWERVQEAKIK